MSNSTDVFVYIVTARVFAMDKVEEFEVNIIKRKAKESKSTYLWEGRRLSKDKLLIAENHQDGDRLVGFRTYCLESDIEKAKEVVIDKVKQQVRYRYDAIVTMQGLLQGEPTINIKEPDREED